MTCLSDSVLAQGEVNRGQSNFRVETSEKTMASGDYVCRMFDIEKPVNAKHWSKKTAPAMPERFFRFDA
jgi:hypothetical protein